MFCGQGSQYFGMGTELYSKHSVFRSTADRLDDIAASIIGRSVIQSIYDPSKKNGNELKRTLYSHPALFIIQYSLAYALLNDGITPAVTFGTSLGEFASTSIAGILSADDALEAVVRQAKEIEDKCGPGGMIAVFSDVSLYHENPVINRATELAGINYDSHFVVTGGSGGLEEVTTFLKERGIIYQQLPVSHAFHSSLIDPASLSYKSYLTTKKFFPANMPFISCLEGRYLGNIRSSYLWDVARKPILFREVIGLLEQEGDVLYLDLGTGGTLANFAGRNFRNGSGASSFSVITPFHNELKNLEKIRNAVRIRNFKSGRKKAMISYIFPGQGSQQIGMGGDLFDQFPEITAEANKILGYSIKALCLDGPHSKLLQTQYTQPALYTVNALTYLKMVKDNGKRPDFVAGHSLGEYTALFAAGAFDFGTGLKLVKKRGELMSKAVNGGMAAILGFPAEELEELLKKNGMYGIDIANYNTPLQTVISGEKDEIAKASAIFNLPGVTYFPLNVSGAFHSRLMEPAKKEYENYISQFSFSELTIPVISNVTARPYDQLGIADKLIAQITHSVKWSETIRFLMGKGEMEFIEIGPGDVLTKMVKIICEKAEPLIVADEEKDNSKEELSNPGDADANEIKKTEIPEFVAIPQGLDVNSGERSRRAYADGCRITPLTLGDDRFKKKYNLKYAYLAGSMYRGISSKEMVVKLGKAGLMGSFGAGGVSLGEIEEAIRFIQKELPNGEPYGVNLLHNPNDPQREEDKIDLFLKCGVNTIDASAYISMTPPLIRYRAHGVRKNGDGSLFIKNRVIAKVSRPEVAEAFLSPAPESLINLLESKNKISNEEARLLRQIPVADDICVEADSGGHTDAGIAYTLMPAMVRLRDDMMKKYGYSSKICIGAAGGIGTPEAAAAAFILGADFIMTGSINHCTIEARTSDVVKDMLQQMNVQDTEYAPAGDMFELGAKVQVLKRGVFFPARANKLLELYRRYNSLQEIDAKTRNQLEERYFKKSFEEIHAEMTSFLSSEHREKIERDPKKKMSLVFRWYFNHATKIALNGTAGMEVDYQIPCGPALGAFNQWVKGTPKEDWRCRNVDEIGVMLMHDTADLLNQRFLSLTTV